MKFRGVKPFSGQSLLTVTKYLQVDLGKGVSDLIEGLRHLRFGDNFDSFDWTIADLAAGDSVTIPNRLETPALEWWPVRILGENGLVEASASAITKDTITLTNAGSTTISAKIRFVR
jgi:hypothetical protein